MALLLGTDIEDRVNRIITGRVARIGGTVNQLLSYRNCNVEDINLIDGGYGKVAKISSAKKIRSFMGTAKRFVCQELDYYKQGNRVSRDRKTFIMDIHDAHSNISLAHRYDCTISSNVIEHSPNPIFLLLNLYFITRKGGHQFHAIPHYKYTYDSHRDPTDIDHLISDFEKKTDEKDISHNDDYIMSAIEKSGWQRDFHKQYPVSYPYMHFHVFDENNIRQLTEFMFKEVLVDIVKNDDFSDNVVLFENTLNPAFVRKYQTIINQYSKNFL